VYKPQLNLSIALTFTVYQQHTLLCFFRSSW